MTKSKKGLSNEIDKNVQELSDIIKKGKLYSLPSIKEKIDSMESRLGIIEEKLNIDGDTKEIEIDLDEKSLLKLFILAHEKDLSLNQYVNHFFREYIEKKEKVQKSYTK